MGGSNLLNSFAGSPLDTERRYPSMGRGDLFHGWNGPGQRGIDRPMAGGRPYRAIEPDRLYLCGSSTYPGGNVTGNPGYIAAGEILRDLGIRHWWTLAKSGRRCAQFPILRTRSMSTYRI